MDKTQNFLYADRDPKEVQMRSQNRNRKKRWVAVFFMTAILLAGVGVENSFAESCSLKVKVITSKIDHGLNFILQNENGTHLINDYISKGTSKTFTDHSLGDNRTLVYEDKTTRLEEFNRFITIKGKGGSCGIRLRIGGEIMTSTLNAPKYWIYEYNLYDSCYHSFWKKTEQRGCSIYTEIEPEYGY